MKDSCFFFLPWVYLYTVFQVMEMYADTESRGGILEPPGICEVKFRAADQISKMHEVRSDHGVLEGFCSFFIGTCCRMQPTSTSRARSGVYRRSTMGVCDVLCAGEISCRVIRCLMKTVYYFEFWLVPSTLFE